MRRLHRVTATRQALALLLAFCSTILAVAATFHHHDLPQPVRTIRDAGSGPVAAARLHDCLACRVSHGLALPIAISSVRCPAPAPEVPARASDEYYPSAAGTAPASPRAPPIPSPDPA